MISITEPLMGKSPSIARLVPAFAIAEVRSPRGRDAPATAGGTPTLQPVKPRIALVFPVADSVQNVRDFQVRQVFGLLVSDLGGNLQTQWRTVRSREGLLVHFIAKQGLRMHCRRHVQ